MAEVMINRSENALEEGKHGSWSFFQKWFSSPGVDDDIILVLSYFGQPLMMYSPIG